MEVDNTHLRYPGAVAFADLIAHGLYQLGGPYKELLNEAYDDEKEYKTDYKCRLFGSGCYTCWRHYYMTASSFNYTPVYYFDSKGFDNWSLKTMP